MIYIFGNIIFIRISSLVRWENESYLYMDCKILSVLIEYRCDLITQVLQTLMQHSSSPELFHIETAA